MTDDHYFGGQEFEVLIEQGAEQCCEHCRNGDWPGRFRKWLNEIRAEAWTEGFDRGFYRGQILHGDYDACEAGIKNPYRPNEK